MNNEIENPSIELRIVEEFLTDLDIERALAAARELAGPGDPGLEEARHADALAALCWTDLLMECPRWTKRFDDPVIDFAALKAHCRARALRAVHGGA